MTSFFLLSLEVKIGNIKLGGDNSVVVQTMTNTDTNNIEKTVLQCKQLFDAGSELVRITAQTEKEAAKLGLIKKTLEIDSYNKPLIADIHFKPNAAIIASQLVEKIRINPGNYTKDNNNKNLENSLVPLIESCKKHNTAIRIGSNYGSLSKQTLEKFGNTPLGMVEAAWEFIEILVKHNFYNIVVSMKAGNVKIMVDACRLLQKKMENEKLIFPQHLGVTEAGNGMDARVKSTIGIATLLSEQIGDTIRVSLTENPVKEIPVAQKIIDYFSDKSKGKFVEILRNNNTSNVLDKYIIISDSDIETDDSQFADFVFIDDIRQAKNSSRNYLCEINIWHNTKNVFPIFSLNEYHDNQKKSEKYNFIFCTIDELQNSELSKIEEDKTSVIILEISSCKDIFDLRTKYHKLLPRISQTPIILKKVYKSLADDFIINASGDLGSILIDKLAQGIWIENKNIDSCKKLELSFSILQATKLRISKTEFISCPTCGRTKFNIEEITNQVKEKTSHLKGLKIAVMGCVVNGPGEMADADYGYVGSLENKVHLYKGQEIIKKNIAQENALEELINIIKAYGDWVERI